jgi:hypothetical protein
VWETGVPDENHRPAASHSQTLYNVVLSTPLYEWDSSSQRWIKNCIMFKFMIIYTCITLL